MKVAVGVNDVAILGMPRAPANEGSEFAEGVQGEGGTNGAFGFHPLLDHGCGDFMERLVQRRGERAGLGDVFPAVIRPKAALVFVLGFVTAQGLGTRGYTGTTGGG